MTTTIDDFVELARKFGMGNSREYTREMYKEDFKRLATDFNPQAQKGVTREFVKLICSRNQALDLESVIRRMQDYEDCRQAVEGVFFKIKGIFRSSHYFSGGKLGSTKGKETRDEVRDYAKLCFRVWNIDSAFEARLEIALWAAKDKNIAQAYDIVETLQLDLFGVRGNNQERWNRLAGESKDKLAQGFLDVYREIFRNSPTKNEKGRVLFNPNAICESVVLLGGSASKPAVVDLFTEMLEAGHRYGRKHSPEAIKIYNAIISSAAAPQEIKDVAQSALEGNIPTEKSLKTQSSKPKITAAKPRRVSQVVQAAVS